MPLKKEVIFISKRTKEEQEVWNSTCDYIKKHILRYGENEKFPSYLATRLLGLRQGKFIANNKVQSQAEYPYEVLYGAVVSCRKKVVDYMHHNKIKIKDERHKINLIIKFVESEINDIYNKYLAQQNTEKKVESLNLENQFNERAEYKRKSKDVPERLKDLW